MSIGYSKKSLTKLNLYFRIENVTKVELHIQTSLKKVYNLKEK
jgi:hypothetical protein